MTMKSDQNRPRKTTKTASKQTGGSVLTVDVYTSTGVKKGTAALPAVLFGAPINEGLMHQALVRQQSNSRAPIAHVKSRGEVRGSTRKLFQQKGTGRARRGSVRSPVLRGGGKVFGPRNTRNFTKDMPKKMRRAALRSCLSLQAQHRSIIALEDYANTIKTKQAWELLQKLPVECGRRILFVTPEKHEALRLSMRNIPNVKVITAAYLNPEDILVSKHLVFLVEALKKAEEVFGKEGREAKEAREEPSSAEATAGKKEGKGVMMKKAPRRKPNPRPASK